MIRAERETPGICADCERPDVTREVDVLNTHGGRRVTYTTHAASLHHASHTAALERIDRFHERLHTLQRKVLEHLRENRPKGFLVIDCEIESIRPTACAVRTEITPTFTIQAFGLRGSVRLESGPLKGRTVAKIVREFTRAAQAEVAKLQAVRDSGEY